jgi:DNA-binding cell septation regulator SpoVG
MADANREICASLWSKLKVTVERFNTVIKTHDKSTFLGYADVKIDASAALPGFVMQLRGIECKILKGNPHIDMPSEKGADGKFYPRYFPQTAELRAVLTAAVFTSDQVKSAVEAAKRATPAPAAGTTDASNPFSA